MKLRSKLLVALLPLAGGLVAISVAALLSVSVLGQTARRVLLDNYRSVLAAQRMVDAADRIDSAALFVLAGRPQAASPPAEHYREIFERELAAARANITEPGEAEALATLGERWKTYQDLYRGFLAAAPEARSALYFEHLAVAFNDLRRAATHVLGINQDAMLLKSTRTQAKVRSYERLVAVVGLLGLLLGLLASASLTTRALRPLGVLSQAVRRVGSGDMEARARGISGSDEVAALATDFNTMTDSLQRYRKSSLGELLEAQQASQAAIDSLSDPVVVLGPGGRALQANRASETLGIAVESGEPLARVPPEVRAVLERVRDHVLGGRGPYTPRGLDEAFAATAEGEERHYLPRATPLYGEGGAVAGAAIVLQDVTRLLRFDELKTNLVSTVAHEFRTPLTSLRMAIHLCTEQIVGPLTEKQADLLHAAREDCARLQTIVDELLDLSRIQAGKIQLRRAPHDVEELAREVLDAAGSHAEGSGVLLRAEVVPQTGSVHVDEGRIALVFANLLGNAIRYSPRGGEVVLRAAPAGDRVRFEVSDRGPGIPREHRAAIFDRHFQMPGQPAGAAGLGLYIAKEIVQAHGGTIEIADDVDVGTTFRLWLPVAA